MSGWLRLRAFGNGEREASICVDRDLEEGFEEVPLFDGDHCERVPGDQFVGVQARSFGGSTAVAHADDFGTSSDAPTVSGR